MGIVNIMLRRLYSEDAVLNLDGENDHGDLLIGGTSGYKPVKKFVNSLIKGDDYSRWHGLSKQLDGYSLSDMLEYLDGLNDTVVYDSDTDLVGFLKTVRQVADQSGIGDRGGFEQAYSGQFVPNDLVRMLLERWFVGETDSTKSV
jgi:hypothetical protein